MATVEKIRTSEAVLVSTQLNGVESLVSGKKTIWAQKTAPKLEVPFKCYIYCTKSKDNSTYKQYKIQDLHCGKVVGEFMCDKIEKYSYSFWHISDLKIYDKPKELSEFKNFKGQSITRPPQSWCYVKV